jgi:hypothetical protein
MSLPVRDTRPVQYRDLMPGQYFSFSERGAPLCYKYPRSGAWRCVEHGYENTVWDAPEPETEVYRVRQPGDMW